MKELYLKDNIYYRINDFKPDRQTLVFIHGLSGSSSAWLPYEEKLKDKFNLLTFDLRGHGKSIKYKDYHDYEIKNFVTDMHELLTYLNIQNPIMISHSFGTLIALQYITKYGSNIKSSIFLSPEIMVGESIQAAVLRFLLKLVKIFDYIPFNKKFGDHVDYKKHPNTGDWNIPRSFADVRNTTLRIYLYCLKQSLEFERNSMLEDLKIPTLIVHGENDSIVPVHNSIFMSNKIKGSKLEIIPNTDHIVVLNNSKEILEILEREFSAASYL